MIVIPLSQLATLVNRDLAIHQMTRTKDEHDPALLYKYLSLLLLIKIHVSGFQIEVSSFR